jgi:hypothetical protein
MKVSSLALIFLAVSGAHASSADPIQKVIQMISDLEAKVLG